MFITVDLFFSLVKWVVGFNERKLYSYTSQTELLKDYTIFMIKSL